MFNLAITWKEAKHNPVLDVVFLEEPPAIVRFLSQEEAERLIECSSPHLVPIVITALNTGMRKMEILNLKRNQVHLNDAIEPFIELTETKSGKSRYIELNDAMIDLMKNLFTENDSEYVFLGTHGKKLTWIKDPWKGALKRAGITEFRFHDLRHTFASHFVMNGGDPLALKQILDHSTMKMVEKYAHLSTQYKKKQINKVQFSQKLATYMPPQRI